MIYRGSQGTGENCNIFTVTAFLRVKDTAHAAKSEKVNRKLSRYSFYEIQLDLINDLLF